MIKIEYKNYLEEILKEYYKTHLNPEHNISKEDLEKYIEDYISNNDITDNYEFRYFILHVLKRLNGTLDNHTALECRYALPLPFKLKFLTDSFYVIDGTEEELKYSKLESINGISIDIILNRLEEITSYETIYWLYLKEENELKDMYFLRMLPEIGNVEKLTYTFIKDGKTLERKYDKSSVTNGFYPTFEDNATYKIIDNKVVYKLNSCMKDERYGFKEKIDSSCNEVDKLIEEEYIKEFILDLRGNSGGSDTILGSLYALFDKYINKIDFKVLVDRETFSCGTIVLRYLLERGNITVIGEGIGEPFNDFGNFKNMIELGDTFRFHASNKYFCFTGNHLVWTSDKNVYNGLTDEQKRPYDYTPDIIVNESIEDIKEGRDIVLETAMQDKKVKKV